MTYPETLDFLLSFLPMYQRVGPAALKHDLNNTLRLCAHLGNPQAGFTSLHIAGTNGKGSSSHLLAAILQSAGYKTGLYTSPHLKDFTERIRVNGNAIGQEEVVGFVEVNRHIMNEIKPSFFEMTVAMAFDHFNRQQVDMAVVEVGLGGRLDSTNIITPLVSLITNISTDHQDILGDTLSKIAAEKAGIIKPGIPVVIGEYQPEVQEVFNQAAAGKQAPISVASGTYTITDHGMTEAFRMVDVVKNGKMYLPGLRTSLGGFYQLKNIPGILQVVDLLVEKGYDISKDHIRTGFEQVQTLTGIKGRWQILGREPLVICDTGHNESGISQIMDQLATMEYNHLHIVFGAVKDKKLDKVLALLPARATYYFCQAKVPRALDAALLLQQAAAFGLKGTAVPDVNQALEHAKSHAEPRDLVFIGGSSFVVAEIAQL